MDQDSEGARRRAAMEPEAKPVPDAAERPKEYFSVRLTLSGSAQDFADPRLAGEAFFRADPAERPSVTHVDGNTARTMARTEVHGVHEGGGTQYFKSLPDSHAPDAAFRAGFLAAMEASISARLERAERGRNGESLVARIDTGLKDDLEAFARRAPEKAASLWSDRTEEPAPGPTLQAAVKAREDVKKMEVFSDRAAPAETPVVITTGDWVTTDRDVDLRPVAVASGEGVHAGFEAKLPGGETEIRLSERAFANSRDALRYAWDFYEGGEKGLQIAVDRAAAMDRELGDNADRAPSGLVLEHREQPEFPRPETAIYAGEEAQLVLVLGRDTEASRDLAARLIADPGFREVVAAHIPEAEATLGAGRFVDGEGSRGFLPDELLAVTAYGRDGSAEVLARVPDEGPLSEALARHLAKSPVVMDHVEEERLRSDLAADPARALSAWVAEADARIDRLPPERQDDLRSELQGIAREAAQAFGLDREEAGREAPPTRNGHDLGETHDSPPVATLAERLHAHAARLVPSAPNIDLSSGPDPMVDVLDRMAALHARQGSVAFRTETQAREFAEEMTERFGASILTDLAAGRTDALARDVPDARVRQAMAAAVISAAREHPSLGLGAPELDAAERRRTTEAAPKPHEHARAQVHDRAHVADMEF